MASSAMQNPDLNSKQYDDLFKIIIIGDSGVGKSCLLLRFADDTFSDNYYTTIGVDFRFKCLNINDKKIKLQIWDTAGQERFKTVTSAYYRGADGIIIVYDQTDRPSFDHWSNWWDDIAKYTTDVTMKLIIANKDDWKSQKIITDEEMSAFTSKTGIEILKTSAKSAYQVEFAFEKLTLKLLNQREKKEMYKGQGLEQTPIEGRLAGANNCCN